MNIKRFVPIILVLATACSATPPGKTGADATAAKDAENKTTGDGAPAEPPKAVETAYKVIDKPEPYSLSRQVYRLELEGTPLGRIRCWIATTRSWNSGEAYDDSHLVEWDPGTAAPPVRYVSLRTGGTVTLRCAAEPVQLPAAQPSTAGTPPRAPVAYRFEPGTGGDGELVSEGRVVDPLKDVPSKPAPKKKNPAAPTPPIVVTAKLAVDYRPDHGSGMSFTQNRSLDPLTPIVGELLSVIADVAVDRVKASATATLNSALKRSLCEIRYADSTSARLHFPEPEQSVEDARADSSGQQLLFGRVCQTLDSVRIEELASSSELLSRALAVDLTGYGFRIARESTDEVTVDLLRALEPIVQGLIEGKAIGTERDFQILLMRLGNTKIGQAGPPRWWQCGIGIGIAVVRECMQRTDCSAEQLLRDLNDELDDPDDMCKDAIADVRARWPGLPSILARTVDVFRPPPGTTSNQTAKAATNILLDVLKASVAERSPSQTRQIESVRTLINAVFDRDLSAGIVAASGLITSAIDDNCARKLKGENQVCLLDVTPAQVKKAVAILNAFVAYASTYRDGPREGEVDKNVAELTKLRHEERKKAMESLIEAATDRASRGGAVIFSLGVGVGATGGRFPIRQTREVSFVPAPSLPLGVALERLPKTNPFGFHSQITVLDLAQYATLDQDGKTAELKVENALYFGGQIGALVGTPQFSAVLAAEIGYAPSVKFDDAHRGGVMRTGLFLGAYVPFVDLN